MPLFLNTQRLNEWIPKLINESEKELVIIVPYIKTSNRIYNHLYEANNRGVETTIVYRENKLNDSEKVKLQQLDNLNLMHHPNIHCKCYYNEKYLIISSINLYEYSEENNREMGVLFSKESLPGLLNNVAENEHIFKDAVEEIRAIINAAQMEKRSRETKTEGFELNIIKTEKEKTEEACQALNKLFLHKKFEPLFINNAWKPVCKNYFDKVDIVFDYRTELNLNFPEEKLSEIFNRFLPYYHEYRITGFKLYWNYHTSPIYLYADSKHKFWQTDNENEIKEIRKQGIDELISFIRKFM